MGDLAERIRIRLLPALLTALGVAGPGRGLLSLTQPGVAEPLPSASPTIAATPSAAPSQRRRRRRSSPSRRSLRTRRRRSSPTSAGRPRRDPGPRSRRSRSTCPIIRQATPTASRCATSRCTSRIPAEARPAGPGPRHLPLRARPDRDVPPDPGRVAGPERQVDAGHGRRGLDERRPALPVRDHRGPAARSIRQRPRTRRSSATREELWLQTSEGVGTTSPSSRSSPCRSRRRPPTRPMPTRCPSRGCAADSPA